MNHERWYMWLLRLYPREFRDRFSRSMVQTFRDMDRERRDAGQSAPGFLAWVFFETTTGAIKENAAMLILSQRHLIHTAIATACLLMVPLVLTLSNPNARIYGGEGGGFDWMPGSFLVMGVMLPNEAHMQHGMPMFKRQHPWISNKANQQIQKMEMPRTTRSCITHKENEMIHERKLDDLSIPFPP